MLFEAHVLQVAKDIESPNEYEDACHFDSKLGFAAIADGVSNALFSGLWARRLVRSLVEIAPGPSDLSAFTQWLAPHREAWLKEIDFPNLDSREKKKLRDDGGAFCTLCWFQLSFDASVEGTNQFAYSAHAIGDSCLFLVREDHIQQSFPLARSEEFDLNPESVCSVMNLNRDGSLAIHHFSGTCGSDDLLVLCTDAVACWLLRCHEQGTPIDWNEFWGLTDSDWTIRIEELRASYEINRDDGMKRDDSTLVLIRPRYRAESAEASELVASTNCDGVSIIEPVRGSEPVAADDARDARQDELVGTATASSALDLGSSITSQTEPVEVVTTSRSGAAVASGSISGQSASLATGWFSRMATLLGGGATQNSPLRSENDRPQDDRP